MSKGNDESRMPKPLPLVVSKPRLSAASPIIRPMIARAPAQAHGVGDASDIARARREAAQSKKDARLGVLRYGFALAHAYESSDMVTAGRLVAEIKLDGILGMAIDGKLINRSGRDVTARFPEIKAPTDAVLVGEICIFGPNGLTEFTKMQERQTDDELQIRILSKQTPAVFVAFDMLEEDGTDITTRSFSERRACLESYMRCAPKDAGFQLIDQIATLTNDAQVRALVNTMRERGGEGIMLKRLDEPWVASRTRNVLKAKTWQERTFDIVRWEWTGVGDGFVVYVVNKGYEQRVNMGDHRMRKAVVDGKAKRVEIKFLSEGPDGAMRFPTTLRLADAREDA